MLSIIIPTYNEEKYLPILLKSIKKQTFKDYEIIVADANSKDKTKRIAKKFNCKITKGGLPAAGRNNGAKIAKGNILLFIDADCIIKSNFLKNALNEIESRKLDVAGCYVWPLSKKLSDNIIFSLYNFWIYLSQVVNPHASAHGIFCKKNIHNKLKGFDETIKIDEDMNYVKRGSKHGKFKLLKSAKTYTSIRRFEVEGRLNLSLKYLVSGMYRLIFGEIRNNIFNYHFNYRK